MFFTFFFFFKTKPTKVCEFSKCLSGFHAFCVSVKAKIFLKYPYVSKKKTKIKSIHPRVKLTVGFSSGKLTYSTRLPPRMPANLLMSEELYSSMHTFLGSSSLLAL